MAYKYTRPLMILVMLLIGGVILTAQSGTASLRAAAATEPATDSAAPAVFKKLPAPKQTKLDLTAIGKIDLNRYPLVPEIPPSVAAIYEQGQKQGNNARIFSKVGDCMTANEDFLMPIANGSYTLDTYAPLKTVIDYFAGVQARGKDLKGGETKLDPFSNPSLAATSGFNAAGVLDATWSDPQWCSADESPITCEYRVSKPAFALIMFGTNDIKSITPDEFDFYLRSIVVQTYNDGIVPIMSTFPTQPGLEAKSLLYNQITVKIATDYNVPLINLVRALDPLPHRGVDPQNTTHMTMPDNGDNAASFTPADLQAGFNVRNLLTLQTLNAVLKVVNPSVN